MKDELRNNSYIMLDPNDNVGVVARLKSIPVGHKIAIKPISSGKPVIKFGQPIGLASRNIKPGEHVHIHNMAFSDKLKFSMSKPGPAKKADALPSHFQGYLRKDGRAGTRNYIIIVSSVNCSASVVREIARHFEDKDLAKKNIDGVIPVTHGSGCGQAIGGISDRMLNRTLAGWIYHPNVVGALVIGLGCEDITIKSINSCLSAKDRSGVSAIESFNIQDAGGTKKAIDLGVAKLNKIISKLPKFKRTPLPVSMLTVALNCGGSDAFSAITANLSLGIAGDILASKDGTIVLGETPECFGAENYLSQRCLMKSDKQKLMHIFSRWRELARSNKLTMNNNLAPGNIKGGLTTILEKSLGAVKKGGSSPINQVLEYGERITKKGLVFMDTPGFDPISVTGMAAGGCNLVAFTTGRGSMFGCSIVPTIKISSTSELYKKLKDDIDIDAGKALHQNNVAQVGREIYNIFLKTANGTKTSSEAQKLGREEFVPWQMGENL